jgi:hypothetical protein
MNNTNIELTKDYIHVMCAYIHGQTIERNELPDPVLHMLHGPYVVDDNPEWDWSKYDYRVKEEQKFLDGDKEYYGEDREKLREFVNKLEDYLGVRSYGCFIDALLEDGFITEWNIFNAEGGVFSGPYKDVYHLIRDNK